MPVYSIEARSFCVALAWCHNFWVLKNADSGATLAELHGLAYDRVHQKILPIGTTRDHALRVFLFPHDVAYAEEVGRPLYTTRMYGNSRSHVVYQDTDSLARWTAAVNAMPLLDALDLTYPPFGFNLRAHRQQQFGLMHVRRDHGRAGLTTSGSLQAGLRKYDDHVRENRARKVRLGRERGVSPLT